MTCTVQLHRPINAQIGPVDGQIIILLCVMFEPSCLYLDFASFQRFEFTAKKKEKKIYMIFQIGAMQSLVYLSRTFPDLVEIEVELKSHNR